METQHKYDEGHQIDADNGDSMIPLETVHVPSLEHNNTTNDQQAPKNLAHSEKINPQSVNAMKQNALAKTNINEIEEANDEIAKLVLANRITVQESSKLQSILRDNASMKEKVTKLKLLLGRSSKASKETKAELDAHKRLLDVAKKEVERLNDRVEALASRPTHMDLLADFETNFDRALMNLHSDDIIPTVTALQQGRQSVGQATGNEGDSGDENVSSMLMNELGQARARIEHLEGLNNALMKRSAHLEKNNDQLLSERESINLKISNFQLELRMAKMEAENASRSMREKAASLQEMQMEIDLVTRSAMDANARAAEGIEVAKSVKSDKAQVEELKAKVSALQEWACAAAAAKEAVKEENRALEERLRLYESDKDGDKSNSPLSGSKTGERHLWTKSSSLVVGAGTLSLREIELGNNITMDFETVILRWKFDITPSDQDIMFSILKGKIEERKINEASAIFRNRHVVGGGGGEVQGAFVVQNACTLVWSNEHSWVRPRTVKYIIEALAVM